MIQQGNITDTSLRVGEPESPCHTPPTLPVDAGLSANSLTERQCQQHQYPSLPPSSSPPSFPAPPPSQPKHPPGKLRHSKRPHTLHPAHPSLHLALPLPATGPAPPCTQPHPSLHPALALSLPAPSPAPLCTQPCPSLHPVLSLPVPSPTPPRSFQEPSKVHPTHVGAPPHRIHTQSCSRSTGTKASQPVLVPLPPSHPLLTRALSSTNPLTPVASFSCDSTFSLNFSQTRGTPTKAVGRTSWRGRRGHVLIM